MKKRNLRKFLRKNTYHSWGEDAAMRIFGPKPKMGEKNFRREWKQEHGKEKIQNINCANDASWNKLKDLEKSTSVSVIYTPMGGQKKR